MVVDTRVPGRVWQSARTLPEFWRLLRLRAVSQFGDGLFQAGLAGALLFNPDRAADPWAIAGAFAVLFLPYSLLGPFAGALLDRWDRRSVLVVANAARLVVAAGIGVLLAAGARDLLVLIAALIANGFTRFVSSGLSAALPHVVPREQVIAMNSVAIATGAVSAFFGANFMLVPRRLFGADDAAAAANMLIVVALIAVALVLSLRFAPNVLGPYRTNQVIDGSVAYAVTSGWLHGIRTVCYRPTVAATLSGLAAHRMAFGINTLVVLVLVRHVDDGGVAGLGATTLFVAAGGTGSLLATVSTPAAVRRAGRYTTANAALAAAAIIQVAAATLYLPMLMVCGFALGLAGQTVKLCADSAMQIDVDDARRGHVFAVQDSLFWVSFIAAVTAAAAVVPADGHAPPLVLVGALLYAAGLVAHGVIAPRRPARR